MTGLRTIFGALIFSAGIIVADLVRPSSQAAVAAGIAAVACLAAAARMHLHHSAPEPGSLFPALQGPAIACLAIAFAAAGFGTSGLRLAALEGAFIPRKEGETVKLTGRLANDPRPGRFSSRFHLAVREVEGTKVRERVAVSAYGPLPSVTLGDSVRLTARIKRLDSNDDFDVALARKSIVAKATVAAPSIRRIGRARNPALLAANRFRARIQSAALEGAGRQRAGLLLGLVIGDGRDIPQRVTDDFRASGLSHLTAVSGQNVAMVMAPLVFSMSVLHVGRRVQTAVVLIILALFAVVTRWEPSVLRAVLMASAVLSAWLFGRRSHAVHLLAVVFFVLLAADPLLLWSIGFQLSFAATAGILLVAPLLSASLIRPLQLLRDPQKVPVRRAPRLLEKVVQAAAIGIAAQAAVLPFIAWHFGRVSLVSLPANLLALPLVVPVTILGFAGGVAALVSEHLAKPLMSMAGIFVAGLQGIAALFGKSSRAQISVDGWSFLEAAAACLAFGAAGLWLTGKTKAARWPAVLCPVSLVMASLLPAAASTPPPGMRLTFFDVGQGDAALVQSPSGARILIDGGPDPLSVANKLDRIGFARLDLVVASHGHSDHVEGLGEVLKRFHVRSTMDSGISTPVMRHVLAAAGAASGRFEAVGDEDTIRIGDLRVDFLAPEAGSLSEAALGQVEVSDKAEGSALNDLSVVARVTFGRQCALFPGDLEEQGQASLLGGRRRQIDCTILKAPHHGSGRLLTEFIGAVDPEWVAVSVGRNDYGHPAPRALSIFRQAGARVLRTDRMGDIVLDVSGTGRVTLGR